MTPFSLSVFRVLSRSLALLACASALAAVLAAPARASGTVTIQQADGSVKAYPNSQIKVIHDALYITSSDGKGTLVVTRAACFYQQQVLVCFPLGVTLVEPGETGALTLRRGTIYTNTTSQPQQLAHSSTQLPPNGILLSFTTKRGTSINVSGTIDGVTK